MNSKSKFILVSMVVVISIVGYCKIHQSENLSTLLLENVEALADDEEMTYIECYGSGSVDCPINHIKVKEVYAPYSLLY